VALQPKGKAKTTSRHAFMPFMEERHEEEAELGAFASHLWAFALSLTLVGCMAPL
jgi:hypothetical protein